MDGQQGPTALHREQHLGITHKGKEYKKESVHMNTHTHTHTCITESESFCCTGEINTV